MITLTYGLAYGILEFSQLPNVSASSPLVGFDELNDNTIKGLTRKELKETQSLCGNLNNVDIGKP